MRSLAIGFTVLILVHYIEMKDMPIKEDINILDDILIYPVPSPETVVKKREALRHSSENLKEFLVEKLTQHSQALEHLLKNLDRQEDVTNRLIEHLIKTVEKPKLPAKVEIQIPKEHIERRSNSFYETRENPILRLGKNIPMYGRLAKDLFMEEIESDTDPTPLVEINPDNRNLEYTRRSFGDDPSQNHKNDKSPWCEEAILCEKTSQSICGFDDKFGYGKFDDICHMLHVNCYYKYNFALAHTCHPTI